VGEAAEKASAVRLTKGDVIAVAEAESSVPEIEQAVGS
jgi:hypothetical protein